MPDFIATDSSMPRNLYTAAQVRQLDNLAIHEFDIAGIKLMRRAGAAAFSALLERWPQTRHVLVFAGGGNNGGDGYILSGLAKQQGMAVQLVYLSDPSALKGDAALARDEAASTGVSFTPATEFFARPEPPGANSVIVDALLGTGLTGNIKDDYARAITWINTSTAPVLAIDIPSGLHADTGAAPGNVLDAVTGKTLDDASVKASDDASVNVSGGAVYADVTVTFIGMKRGLLTNAGRDYAGTICFANLDVPKALYNHAKAPQPEVERFDINTVTTLLRPRPRSAHKGSNGHVLVIGGDTNYGGAALMTAEAAALTGSGLVSVITRSAHRPAILERRPEVIVLGTEDDDAEAAIAALFARATVLCIGPGLGQSQWANELFRQTLAAQRAHNIPLVCDADGLHALVNQNEAGSSGKRDNWILTPHPGEAAALLGVSVAEVQADRFHAVRKLQETWGGACLLKGSGSLCYTGSGRISLCTEGNPGMASGGMGDVLSGIIAGLLAQGLSPADALRCAVAIHGEAADLASAKTGERGLLATDLFSFLRILVNPDIR